MSPLPRFLVIAGAALILAGLLVHLLPSMPLLGRLPGDIRIERPGFRFYFPITTCLAASAVITLLLWLASRIH